MIEYGIIEIAWWQAILAVIVGVVGAARLTRVLTIDDYPPSIAIRVWWQGLTKDGAWAKLVTFLHPALGWIWWIFWGWLALSYWTSQYVYFDEGRGEG
jgi:hypothetical protein